MRSLLISLLAVFALAVTDANAASYVQLPANLMDPILDTLGSPHAYSGADLEPGAHLTAIMLEDANLTQADLAGSTLTGATLQGSKLLRASFANSHLVGANLDYTNLRHAESVSYTHLTLPTKA